MDVLPDSLIEIILGFSKTKDIKNFVMINKRYNKLVEECLKIGYIHLTKIFRCINCNLYIINSPIILVIKCFNQPSLITPYLNKPFVTQKIFYLCSRYCKNRFYCWLPRCYSCLTVILHNGPIINRLFCSDICFIYNFPRI